MKSKSRETEEESRWKVNLIIAEQLLSIYLEVLKRRRWQRTLPAGGVARLSPSTIIIMFLCWLSIFFSSIRFFTLSFLFFGNWFIFRAILFCCSIQFSRNKHKVIVMNCLYARCIHTFVPRSKICMTFDDWMDITSLRLFHWCLSWEL